MKKIFSIIILFVLVSAANVMAQDKFANWPALADFHTVMSATFHPAEKGNFSPVKERSTELATKAAVLSKSIIPENYNQAKLQKVLKMLASDTKALDKLVKKKSKDEVINKSLIAVHNRFHEIVGLCKDEAH